MAHENKPVKVMVVSGQKRPGGPITVQISPQAQKLIDALCNTAFDCGEWTNESDYPFDDCEKAAEVAEYNLAEYIAALENDTPKRELSPYAKALLRRLPPYVSRIGRD